MKRIGFLSLALAAMLAAGCNSDRRNASSTTAAGGSSAVGTSGSSESKVSRGDTDFVHDAAIANMAELDLARLADERSTNADVKKFARTMIDDHTAAGEKLQAIATQRTIEIPAQIDDKHRDLHDKLAKRQGFEFDRDYIDAMVDGHKDFVNKLESRIDREDLAKWKSETADKITGDKARVEGKAQAVLPERSDDQITMSINQWAADTYPTAVAHLEAAKALADTLKKRTTN